MANAQQSDSPNPSLPEGTVTFLFTDIEGSTKLLHRLGDKYISLLDDHHRILREIFAKWNGREVDTEGDAFFVSFPKATEAVAAVVEAQRSLAEHEWPGGVTILVRMGLHTGEPWTGSGGYVGMDVHRAARIAHVGYGGQVLLSETTAALLRGNLPDDVTLRDLGQHLLKDMQFPEHIRQLVISGLPDKFPPLKSLEVVEAVDETVLEPPPLPDFLTEDSWHPRPDPVFVGRDNEMAFMTEFLDALFTEGDSDNRGNLLFVTGDAGSGKTALMDAFSRLALVKYLNLLVAQGFCNAFTGAGDPYLPFRSVMGMLTGDLESRIGGKAVSREQVVNLWRSFPSTLSTIAATGPDLIDIMVRGATLKSRVKKSVPSNELLLQKLSRAEKQRRATSGELNQSQLFDQYVSVLQVVSQTHPILIILDDLQWADSGTINLLFHLARGMTGCRVLVIGAYRPEEIALGRGGDRHPLEPVLAELKREFGQIWINLNEAKGEAFVHDFLKSEPSRLSAIFHQTLLQHTGGQALFTVETLRDLQERGDLVQDDDGYWVESQSLDWEKLPTRVEGVIEARIERLEEELREVLSVAAVEGEDFTAQVIARIQQIQERKLLRTLSRELEKRHHLVIEQKEDQIGALLLTRYRFTHALFQRYLYNDLGTGERRLLHGEIGAILEDLYSDRLDEVTVQLAGHYAEAGDAEKAVKYLLKSGDIAIKRYAYQDSIDLYQRALTLLKQQNRHGQASRTLMTLGLLHNDIYQFGKARDCYQEAFVLSSKSSTELPSSPPPPPAIQPLRVHWLSERILDPMMTGEVNDILTMEKLFCPLLKWELPGRLVPYACESWEILDKGCRYRFHLRGDMKWTDGVPLTSGDFKFAWLRALTPSTNSLAKEMLFIISGAREYHEGTITDTNLVGIQDVDAYTLDVTLDTPVSFFLNVLHLGCLAPVPRHIVSTHGSDWTSDENIVTCGPFLLEASDPEKPLSFVRNTDFPIKSIGNVQRVELLARSTVSYTDAWKHLLDLYETDALHSLSLNNLPASELDRICHRYASDYVTEPWGFTNFVGFDVKAAPLDDLRVRRALALAIDKEHISDIILKGYASPALGGFIPPPIPGHSRTIGLSYNPSKARKLLAAAGYIDGAGFPSHTIQVGRGLPMAEVVVSAISHQWNKELGLNIIPKVLPARSHLKILYEDLPPIWYAGWILDYPDPDSFLRVSRVRENANWTNDKFDRLIDQASILKDHHQRMKLYQQADRILTEEAVVLPIIYRHEHYLLKPWVTDSRYWEDVIMEPH